jgi:hypothetical protein
MLAELSSAEYEEWYQFWLISPWGGAREDLRAGLVASEQHNAWYQGEKVRPDDYFPNLKDDAAADAPRQAPEPDTPQTPQELAATLREWATMTGGKVA